MADEEQGPTDTEHALTFLDVKLLAVTFLAKYREGGDPASPEDWELAKIITASEDDPDDNEKRRLALIAAERILGKKGDYEYDESSTHLDPLTT